jgi:hypothetical protein
LSAENAKVVARHMVCVNLYMDVDPELAHKHAVASSRSRDSRLCCLPRRTL